MGRNNIMQERVRSYYIQQIVCVNEIEKSMIAVKSTDDNVREQLEGIERELSNLITTKECEVYMASKILCSLKTLREQVRRVIKEVGTG